MIVGTLRVRLLLREARTLKDKRQVVKSIKDRLRNHFNVSVAEVDELDNRQIAVLGVAQTWHVYVIALLFGVGAAFDAPARQSFVSEMVGRDDLTNAVGLKRSGSW